MKRVDWASAAATVGAAFVLLSSRRRYRDEARDLAYEEWIRRQPRSAPPREVFARWRRGFGQQALISAIRDVAVNNVLTAALVNRVLYLRGQAAFILVD